MLVIRWMNFSTRFVPYSRVDGGEIRICLCRSVVYVGNVELVGQRHGFLIHTCSSNNEHFFFSLAMGKGFLQRTKAFGSAV